MTRTIIALLILTSSVHALALDGTVGETITCANWLKERSKLKAWTKLGGEMPQSANIWGTWLLGVPGRLRLGLPARKTFAEGLDTTAVFERVDGICRSHPKPDAYPLLLATHDLIKQLDPRHLDVCVH